MDRRKFIKTNAALTAGIILPNAILSQSKDCYKSTYYGNIAPGVSDEFWKLTGKICEKMTMDFDSANENDKLFELSVRYYKNGLSKGSPQKGKYIYKILRVDTDQELKTAVCKAKCQSMDETGYAFPKSMFKAKRITLKVNSKGKKRVISINSKKGLLATLSRTISSSSGSGGSGCYLTTACVEHLRLKDNCSELETLRHLRDNYMASTIEGQSLIQDYDSHAPLLVDRINTIENKSEIYNIMYDKMIIPSVELINQGNYERAMNLYKEFATLLHNKYTPKK